MKSSKWFYLWYSKYLNPISRIIQILFMSQNILNKNFKSLSIYLKLNNNLIKNRS